jgi:hypothetical protein
MASVVDEVWEAVLHAPKTSSAVPTPSPAIWVLFMTASLS